VNCCRDCLKWASEHGVCTVPRGIVTNPFQVARLWADKRADTSKSNMEKLTDESRKWNLESGMWFCVSGMMATQPGLGCSEWEARESQA
jgi:hypothetical protein